MKTPALRIAVATLTLAVLAGVAETMITVVGLAQTGDFPPQWQLQVGVRTAVYVVALGLIGLTWRGSRVARWAVLIMLGVIGFGSMVVPLIAEVASGVEPVIALGGDTSPLFPIVRSAHLVLVLAGSIALLAHRPGPRRIRRSETRPVLHPAR